MKSALALGGTSLARELSAVNNEHLRETVKVDKFVLPEEALPHPVVSVPETAAVPLTDDEERAYRIVTAALWITSATIAAALWLLTS